MLRFSIQEPRRGQLRRALQLPLGMLFISLTLGAPKEAWACACVPVENAWDDLVLFYGTALEKAERPEFPTSCESREEAWADEFGSPSEQTAQAGRYLVESSNVLPAGEEVVLFARAGSCGQLPLELGHKGVVGAKWSSGVLVTHNCFQLFDDWKEIHRRLGVPADPPQPTSVQPLPAGAKLSQPSPATWLPSPSPPFPPSSEEQARGIGERRAQQTGKADLWKVIAKAKGGFAPNLSHVRGRNEHHRETECAEARRRVAGEKAKAVW